MKKLLYLTFTILLFFSCNKETNYVTFSGEIKNKNTDSLIIFHPITDYKKVIHLEADGTFKDTLKVANGMFSMTDNEEFTLLYLINGYDLIMNYDAKQFDETLQFTGKYSLENEFLKTSMINENSLFSNETLMSLPQEEFQKKVTDYVSSFNARINDKQLDADFSSYQKEEIVNFKEYLENEYLEENFNKLVLGKGKPSPEFKDYENYKGGTTSLSDFKGKYVYIDIWATWCQPCKFEIPHLQKLEKEYHNKNIEFVSISLDDKRNYDTWKKMVSDKKLGGVQLYAKGDKSFINGYRVKSIPRFIMIDPDGNIFNADAPRPSSLQLKDLLKSIDL